MAASGQAAQLAQMARLMDAQDGRAAPAPIKTSLDKTWGDIPWASFKPTKDDEKLVKDLVKLPPDQLVERLGTLASRDRDRLVQISWKVLGLKPNAITVAIDTRPADVEAAFIRNLARMPEADFKKWFAGAKFSETEKIATRFNEDASKIFGGDMDSARGLMDRYNRLKDERVMQKVLGKYTGETETSTRPAMTKQEIEADIRAKLAKDLKKHSYDDHNNMRDVLKDMRLLAANKSPEAQEVYETYVKALGDAIGTDWLAATWLAEEAANLDVKQGEGGQRAPGSAEVKAALIPMLYKLQDSGKPVSIEKTVEALIRSDPAGVLEVMEGADLEGGKKLINRALQDIAKVHEKDHAKLQEVMSDILAPFAAKVALAAAAEPWDANASTELDSTAHDLGVALGAVQNAVDGLGKEARKKIADGAFILSVFHKGVAKISGVAAIEKAGEKIVGFLSDLENKKVDEWTTKIKEATSRVVDEVFQARTGGMERVERRRRQDPFEMALNAGYDKTRALKG